MISSQSLAGHVGLVLSCCSDNTSEQMNDSLFILNVLRTTSPFPPTYLTFICKGFMEFMTWFVWCGTVPHVSDGELESMLGVLAKNNWLLHCGTAQILWTLQYVIWVCVLPAVQSILLARSGTLSFLLVDFVYAYKAGWTPCYGGEESKLAVHQIRKELAWVYSRPCANP